VAISDKGMGTREWHCEPDKKLGFKFCFFLFKYCKCFPGEKTLFTNKKKIQSGLELGNEV
jgi:hypothetical protein